jgi:hypothetical protein
MKYFKIPNGTSFPVCEYRGGGHGFYFPEQQRYRVVILFKGMNENFLILIDCQNPVIITKKST